MKIDILKMEKEIADRCDCDSPWLHKECWSIFDLICKASGIDKKDFIGYGKYSDKSNFMKLKTLDVDMDILKKKYYYFGLRINDYKKILEIIEKSKI